MKILAIIPARMDSTRFPGKPLALIQGIPMIGHIYKRTVMCDDLTDTYVATCDQVIMDYIQSIGGKAVMTKNTHERCTDRCSEALLKIEEMNKTKYDCVVIIQGDEPLVTPTMISTAVNVFKANNSDVVNLMKEIEFDEDYTDANEVKVVCNAANEAMYFSREAIPSQKKSKAKVKSYKQVAIMPFKREFLFKFSELTPTPLEIIESVDMLRVLEHGLKVHMAEIKEPIFSVDTPADLEWVDSVMKKDKLFNAYKNR